MSLLTGESVVRLRQPTTTDDYGDTIPDPDTPPTTSTITNVMVAPRTPQELQDLGRDGSERGWTLLCPAGTTALVTDQFSVRGETFNVDGTPEDWGSAGVKISTILVEG